MMECTWGAQFEIGPAEPDTTIPNSSFLIPNCKGSRRSRYSLPFQQ